MKSYGNKPFVFTGQTLPPAILRKFSSTLQLDLHNTLITKMLPVRIAGFFTSSTKTISYKINDSLA